jgi:DNA-binding NarL/FixJ family response regulator
MFGAAVQFRTNMSEVTQILEAIQQGHPHAAEELLPLVYDELRKLAAHRMASGLENREIAEMLGISERTVERAWRFAKAWLLAELSER